MALARVGAGRRSSKRKSYQNPINVNIGNEKYWKPLRASGRVLRDALAHQRVSKKSTPARAGVPE